MNSPGQILPEAARRYGNKVALICGDSSYSFSELNEASDRVATSLAAAGVRSGQTVSLFSQNRWEWVVAYHGALKAGAVVNPVNVMLTPEELAYVLSDCGSVALFAGAEQARAVLTVADRLPRLGLVVDLDGATSGATDFRTLLAAEGDVPQIIEGGRAPCTIGYTSGTTGHPKGAVQSHEAVLLNCALTATMHGRTERDIVVTALPAPHVYGNVVINGTWLAGGAVVLMERFDPAEALRLIEEHHATMFEGVPAMYATMLDHEALPSRNLSSLTRCTVGGQTMPDAASTRWETVSGAPLIELWGMTELSGLGTTHALYAPRPRGSIGVSLPGVEVRVADLEDGARDADYGTPGELLVRGPLVMLGYHGNPEATAEAIDHQGWLHTGDVAVKDQSGHLFLVDRRKDMIITGGYNVYPAEIERVLMGHPGVAMVGVGAVPDRVKGELACAYVVRSRGSEVSREELTQYAAKHLAAYKRPRLVEFVQDLPKTSSGKIMRRELVKLIPAPTDGRP